MLGRIDPIVLKELKVDLRICPGEFACKRPASANAHMCKAVLDGPC